MQTLHDLQERRGQIRISGLWYWRAPLELFFRRRADQVPLAFATRENQQAHSQFTTAQQGENYAGQQHAAIQHVQCKLRGFIVHSPSASYRFSALFLRSHVFKHLYFLHLVLNIFCIRRSVCFIARQVKEKSDALFLLRKIESAAGLPASAPSD